jgi:Flp pilus assembly pilin Flp
MGRERVTSMVARCRRDRGAAVVEYALILGLAVLVGVPAINWMQDSSEREFQSRSASAGAPDLDDVVPTSSSTTTVPSTTTPPSTTTALSVDATASLAATTNRQGNTWSATVTATVVDQNGVPVSGATVTGAWDPVLSGETSCTTGANGQCTMTQAGMEARDNKPFVAEVSFAITTVTKTATPGFSYQQSPPPQIGPLVRPT